MISIRAKNLDIVTPFFALLQGTEYRVLLIFSSSQYRYRSYTNAAHIFTAGDISAEHVNLINNDEEEFAEGEKNQYQRFSTLDNFNYYASSQQISS